MVYAMTARPVLELRRSCNSSKLKVTTARHLRSSLQWCCETFGARVVPFGGCFLAAVLPSAEPLVGS